MVPATMAIGAMLLSCSGEPKPVRFCGKTYMPKDTSVTCSQEHYTNIDSLKDLKNLENLDISGTKVKLLEGLSKAYKLKILNLSRTQVDSIGKLKDLKNITHLHVDRTWVKEFDGIQGLTKMMVLSASWTRVKDLEPLLPLTRLVELYLDGCGAKLEKGLDLSPLKELRSLRRLALWQSGATRQGIDELKRANPHLQVMGCEGPGDWPCK